jgi:uncharacterized protein
MSELSFKPADDSTPLQKAWEVRKYPLLAPIWLYKKCVSPLMPPACRHYPTCSEYAFMAIKQKGIVRGTLMGTWRVLRCNPWGTSGYDPVEAFRWPWQSDSEFRMQNAERNDATKPQNTAPES